MQLFYCKEGDIKGAPGLESRTPGGGGSPANGPNKKKLEPPIIRVLGHQIDIFGQYLGQTDH